jgi:hypothetical protein
MKTIRYGKMISQARVIMRVFRSRRHIRAQVRRQYLRHCFQLQSTHFLAWRFCVEHAAPLVRQIQDRRNHLMKQHHWNEWRHVQQQVIARRAFQRSFLARAFRGWLFRLYRKRHQARMLYMSSQFAAFARQKQVRHIVTRVHLE